MGNQIVVNEKSMLVSNANAFIDDFKEVLMNHVSLLRRVNDSNKAIAKMISGAESIKIQMEENEMHDEAGCLNFITSINECVDIDIATANEIIDKIRLIYID